MAIFFPTTLITKGALKVDDKHAQISATPPKFHQLAGLV